MICGELIKNIESFTNIWSNRILDHWKTIFSYPFTQSDKDATGKYRKLNSCKESYLQVIESLFFYTDYIKSKTFAHSFSLRLDQ